MQTRQPISLLAERQETVREICRRFGVEQLDVFGSAARGDFTRGRSDIDLLVRFADAGAPGYVDRYIGLAESLESALACPVDLLTERSLRNPILIEQIKRDRVNLYAA